MEREVDALVHHLAGQGPQSQAQLSRLVAARHWGPGRLRTALRSGVASGRILRLGHSHFAAAHAEPAGPDGRHGPPPPSPGD
ncbi:MAG TPA: hypothetical protein VMF60_06745 [Acidimicrobiales bacterium]|nr:hypothetical protein [Acidimicrobiales bacterium]